MSKLKHQILQHLVEHGELNLNPSDRYFPKTDKDELDAAAQELDQAGHGVYTRTLHRLYLNSSPKTKKAFEDGVYLEKRVVPTGAAEVKGVDPKEAPEVKGTTPHTKVAKAAKAPAKKKDQKK